MVSISLADRLTVETAEELAFACDDPAVPAGSDNLVVRAAHLLASRAGVPARARIRLEKRTPMGGGLGGGSADAAVALRLLAALWEIDAAPAWLSGLAAELGSDVPFFLTGGQADVTGRGEIVTPVPDGPARRPAPARPSVLGVDRRASTAPTAAGSIWRLGSRSSRRTIGGYLGPNDLASAVLVMEPG